jgi:RNA polymerase sigma factor (sigma-70 family)
MLITMSANDLDLLRDFARDQSQDAFTTIVRRHLDLVYCAALRQVRSPELAEEVAQSVFSDLARDAARLKPDTVLTAWLYEVTRRTAINVVRGEARRRLREQIACEMNVMNATAADWTQIEPLLDEAMHALDDTDRTVVLLRYFENKSLREVGQTLGTSDDTAQKRVSRAVERLREFFAKRGVTIGASGLVLVITANAIQAAPVGLAVTISTAVAITGTTISVTATTTATEAIAITTVQKTLVTAIVVASLVAPLMIQRRAQAQLRHRDETMRQRAEQLAGLQTENERLSGFVAQAQRQSVFSEDQLNELLKLRGEVARLRNRAQELSQPRTAAAQSPEDKLASAEKFWSSRVDRLKQWLEANPSENIPELQLLTDRDWLNFIYPHTLETDDAYARAISSVRGNAESKIMDRLYGAFRQYVRDNGGQFPVDLSQLTSFLDAPIDDAILNRYQIVAATNLVHELRSYGEWVITQKAPVNEALDTRYATGLDKGGGAGRGITNRWIFVH